MTTAREKLDEARRAGYDLEHFDEDESLLSMLFLANYPSFKIIKDLSKQARAGETSEGRAPGNVRAKLCELTRIPADQHFLIIDFVPSVAWKKDIQVVYLRPIFKETLPKNTQASFISWATATTGSSSIILARPSLETPGAFLSSTFDQGKTTFNSLYNSAITSLLWANERGYMSVCTHLSSTPDDAVIAACQLATQDIFR